MSVSSITIQRFQEFYNYLIFTRELRATSAKGHVMYATSLFNYLGEKPLTYENFLQFFSFKRESCKASYINHFIDFVKVYSKYLESTGEVTDPRFYALRYIKEEEVNKATMSDQEIEEFLSLPAKSYTRLHWKSGKVMNLTFNSGYALWTLFFRILAYTGMRPNEVATLTIEAVDFGRNVFIVTAQNSKTHTQRFVPIASALVEPLKEHISKCDKFLFLSKSKQPFDSVDWGYNFHERLKRMNLKRQGLTPYSLRHSFITRLLDEDVNLFKVQKIVGHSRVDTTAKYEHLTTKDIQKAILKHPLIRKNTDPQYVIEAILDFVRGLNLEIKDFAHNDGVLSLNLVLDSNSKK